MRIIKQTVEAVFSEGFIINESSALKSGGTSGRWSGRSPGWRDGPGGGAVDSVQHGVAQLGLIVACVLIQGAPV